MKTRNIIGLVVLAGFMALLLVSFGGNVSEYTDFQEAQKRESDVHVVAKWVRRDEARYDASRDLFSFYLQDTMNNVQLVHYYDPMPVNFDKAQKVVVSGKYQNGVFVADKVLMKCPSKYKDQANVANS